METDRSGQKFWRGVSSPSLVIENNTIALELTQNFVIAARRKLKYGIENNPRQQHNETS